MSDGEQSKALRYNQGKPDYSLLSLQALEPCVRGLEYGANKYGKENWKKGLSFEATLASLMRHCAALLEGQWLDEESGLPHICLIQCNGMFLGHPSVIIEEKFNHDKESSQKSSQTSS